jgi:hypothetical protein
VVEYRLIKVEDFFFLSIVKFSFRLKKEKVFSFRKKGGAGIVRHLTIEGVVIIRIQDVA